MSIHFDIKLLADCSYCLPELAELWFEHIGKTWVPGKTTQEAERTFREHLNRDTLPLTLVAIHQHKPIAMISLRQNDGIREDLTPWLGSLIVHPDYRRLGLGEMLVDMAKKKAKALGYKKAYLFVLDPTLTKWYERLGWQEIDKDHFNQFPVVVMMADLRMEPSLIDHHERSHLA